MVTCDSCGHHAGVVGCWWESIFLIFQVGTEELDLFINFANKSVNRGIEEGGAPSQPEQQRLDVCDLTETIVRKTAVEQELSSFLLLDSSGSG